MDVTIALSPDIPLTATVEKAAEIFSISRTQMYSLLRANEDFPKVYIGGSLRINVPMAYQWFSARTGEHIPVG